MAQDLQILQQCRNCHHAHLALTRFCLDGDRHILLTEVYAMKRLLALLDFIFYAFGLRCFFV